MRSLGIAPSFAGYEPAGCLDTSLSWASLAAEAVFLVPYIGAEGLKNS
jgi:hypothetical protein